MMMGFELILIIAVIAYALGWRPQFNLNNQSGPGGSGQTPREILEARYARGEISREEYEQVRRDLEG